LQLGARQALPGEFSERAFLNDKLDLAQAEAIADLIDASSRQAAKSALNSLVGEFSKKITALVKQLIELRLYVESAIDFPEEEIDFLSDGIVASRLNLLIDQVELVQQQANQGLLIKEGMKVAIVGKPNAGKSSLLNALAEKDVAIVTEIAGTTRDLLREHIQIDGMPLHIIDTAGLRENPDTVEKIGIERAHATMDDADQILLLVDASVEGEVDYQSYWQMLKGSEAALTKLTLVYNKIDKLDGFTLKRAGKIHEFAISAQTGLGLEQLKSHLKKIMGFKSTVEGQFSARRRHIQAIELALQALKHGRDQLQNHQAGELLAEDLRLTQDRLSEITGQFTPDDLLGKIFSSFCIGK
jgi:tRNA modification GTPase